jgi:predicted amidohydrolase
MIFFPEACDYICDNKQDIVKHSEPILGGETVGRYRELAAKYGVWLSMGGVHEKVLFKEYTYIHTTHALSPKG